MAKVDKSKFNNLTTGIQFPNKLIITGGDDTGRAINANQIEWGTSDFLGSALTEGTTEEVLTRIENMQTTSENTWEIYDEELEPVNDPEDEPNGESGNENFDPENPIEPTPVND